ncbi:uncharacterized protein LAESUDRAFT_816792 [Laetiporus sulphureus 93-53]|uniref:Uncharacterized protein n=1 Tax=Laetiporus sulphureus 93-53 TaxID=1314785 RepID=A0A165AYZ9_9APHY|nr:uncharacterized protein LAESUDRAFT_816792 [Laetiporus sulphureus 93-53]KZS99920.1 hypothetical protein LAESUDRAFT_816792 [Laetiporus sulphureus 93-53]
METQPSTSSSAPQQISGHHPPTEFREMPASNSSPLPPPAPLPQPTNAVLPQVPRSTFLPPTAQLGEPRTVHPVAQPPSVAGPSNPAQGRHDVVGQVVWEGSLAWTITGKGTGSAQVSLLARNCVDQLRAMQWPSIFILKPSQHSVLPPQILQDWIERNAGQCAIVHVISQPRLADTKTNEKSFVALARLLADHSRYAVAAFSGPNGENRDRMLLFPGKPYQFVSVVFLGKEGMPELPHEVCGMSLSKIPPQFALLLYKLPQAQQALLMELPQEKRIQQIQAFMAQQMKLQAQAVQQQQQQQAQQQQAAQDQSNDEFSIIDGIHALKLDSGMSD